MRSLLLSVLLAVSMLTGCGVNTVPAPTTKPIATPAPTPQPVTPPIATPTPPTPVPPTPAPPAPVPPAPVPPPPPSRQVVATTTLTAETSNNTSATLFTGSANGNIRGTNVSKVNIHTLLYADAKTKIFSHMTNWWGSSSHMSVGYSSVDPVQIHAQVDDMVSRGYDGAVLVWYGSGSKEDKSSLILMKDLASRPTFQFAIMVEGGAIKWDSCTGCLPTDAMIAHLNYLAKTYYSSPAYLKVDGRPVVYEFGTEAYSIDWVRVRASIQGNPLVVFRNPHGLDKTLSDGAYAWGPDGGNAYLDFFYKTVATAPANKLVNGVAFKGFDDSIASWTLHRLTAQRCGQQWLDSFAEINKFYSTAHPLPYMQVATWNDYEEGTEVETGIESCTSVAASMSGSSVTWTLTGDPTTVDHYTVFISVDGENLMPLADVPVGTDTLDLAPAGFAPGTYSVLVKVVSKPSMTNKMSLPVAVSISADGTVN